MAQDKSGTEKPASVPMQGVVPQQPARLTADQLLLTGVIKDTQGETLPGANIRVRETKAGAVADADGNIITQFPTPNTYDVLCLFFTNDQIQVGKSYKILSYKDSFNDTPVVEYEFSMEEQYMEKIEEKFLTLGSKKSKETTK
jgi:hypothetical protein